MAKYLKDKKIKVQVMDPNTEEYTTAFEGWAYVRHMSGTETFNAGISDNGKRNMLFVFTPPKNLELDTTMRIVYQNINFDVFNIDDFEGYVGDTKFYASGRYY